MFICTKYKGDIPGTESEKMFSVLVPITSTDIADIGHRLNAAAVSRCCKCCVTDLCCRETVYNIECNNLDYKPFCLNLNRHHCHHSEGLCVCVCVRRRTRRKLIIEMSVRMHKSQKVDPKRIAEHLF